MNDFPENDTLYEFHNYGTSIKTREIFLHNYFGADNENPGVEYKMSNVFIKNLRALDTDNNKGIVVHMHSVGGEWSDGMAIFDAISNSPSYISIIAYAQAESMSSIIFQAADARIITENSYFMPHYGSTDAHGDYLNVQNWVNYEKHICEVMFNIYANRCYKGKYFKEKYGGGKESIPKVKSWLKRKLKDGDWYINAEESVYYGFADGVLGDRKYPSISSIKDNTS